MNVLRVARLVAAVSPLATAAAQQSTVRPLSLVADGKVDIARVGGARELLFVVGPDGRSVLAPRNGWGGNVLAFDSSGAAMPFSLSTGRNDKADIGLVTQIGWMSGSAGGMLWMNDPMYREVAFVDDHGKVSKSVEHPSWIHPHWAERHRYPLFRRMDALAVYADSTMLVLPRNDLFLMSVPKYDKSVQHLMRMSWSGAIEREVATLPARTDQVSFKMQRGIRSYTVPFVPRSFWGVSTDGKRITIVSPADSGLIRVTSLDDRGDTVFNRRYPYIAAPVSTEAVSAFMNNIHDAGDISAQTMRDSITKLIPKYQSFVTGMFAGYDYSTWIFLRPASDTAKQHLALVIDPKGDVAGMVPLPDQTEIAAVGLTRAWAYDIGRMRTPTGITRYVVRPGSTVAPLPRTGKASTSPAPAPQRP